MVQVIASNHRFPQKTRLKSGFLLPELKGYPKLPLAPLS